ncbi:hypothetical protein D9M69_477160 [compost metagenome]
MRRARHQRCQHAGAVPDIGIGQPDVAGLRGDAVGFGQPFGLGPDLAAPAGRQLARADHRQRLRTRGSRGSGAGEIGGAVLAVVIDHHQREPPRIALAEHARHRACDHRGLVAGRDDGHHVRPLRRRRCGVRLVHAPEAGAQPQQPAPDRQGQPRQRQRDIHGGFSKRRAGRRRRYGVARCRCQASRTSGPLAMDCPGHCSETRLVMRIPRALAQVQAR